MATCITIIKETVAAHFGLTVEEMSQRTNARALCRPRLVAMALCRELIEGPHSKIAYIARHFERDHTSVINALRRMEAAEMGGDPALAKEVRQLRVACIRAIERWRLEQAMRFRVWARQYAEQQGEAYEAA